MDRKCGECTACCKLVSVKEINKRSHERCPHQRWKKGCAIYNQRPMSCRVWSCVWLAGEDGGCLSRPDRSHFVIDVMTDTVTQTFEDSDEVNQYCVVQVWCDPSYRDAWSNTGFLAWLDRQCRDHPDIAGAVIRFGPDQNGLMLWHPSRSPSGDWLVVESNLVTDERSKELQGIASAQEKEAEAQTSAADR